MISNAYKVLPVIYLKQQPYVGYLYPTNHYAEHIGFENLIYVCCFSCFHAQKYLILFGNFVETLLSDGLPKRCRLPETPVFTTPTPPKSHQS